MRRNRRRGIEEPSFSQRRRRNRRGGIVAIATACIMPVDYRRGVRQYRWRPLMAMKAKPLAAASTRILPLAMCGRRRRAGNTARPIFGERCVADGSVEASPAHRPMTTAEVKYCRKYDRRARGCAIARRASVVDARRRAGEPVLIRGSCGPCGASATAETKPEVLAEHCSLFLLNIFLVEIFIENGDFIN